MSPITEVEGRRLTVTHLEKVLFPATGTTKGELLHYYARVAGSLLAHLRDRPVSLLRFPDGSDGQKFFTKNVPPGTPAWVKTAEVPRSGGKSARQVLLQDVSSLMWAANLVAEFHAPQWKAQAPGKADQLVLDLDPGEGTTVVDCCRVALWLRDRLGADGLYAYAKTSGSKGLHLLVPLEPTPSERASAYAKGLAQEAEDALPDLVVHRMARALRAGKIFVDHGQNSAAKTTATAYTVRARPEPTVSTPVTWDEVTRCRRPQDLTFLIGDIPPRLDRLGNPLTPLLNLNRARPLPS